MEDYYTNRLEDLYRQQQADEESIIAFAAMTGVTSSTRTYAYSYSTKPFCTLNDAPILLTAVDDLRIPRQASAKLHYPTDWSPDGIIHWLREHRLRPIAVTQVGIRFGAAQPYWQRITLQQEVAP
jgi:hypothetical protein